MAIIGFIICFIFSLAITVLLPFFCIIGAAFSGKSGESWVALIPFAIGCFLLYLTIANSPFHISVS